MNVCRLNGCGCSLSPTISIEDAYPQIVPGKLVAAGPTVDDSPDSAFPNNLKESTTQDTKIVYANFFVATYNVGSLHRPRGHATDDGLCPQEYLRKQAQAHGITCLMLQETRAKRTGMVVSDSHIRLIAAGDQGRGGTEIWLAKRSSTGRSLGLQQQDVLVLISEAELLCARVRWPYGNFLIISAHGPHSGSGADEISRWWSKLSDLVTKLHRSDQEWLVIGIDANTNFENDHEPHIGHIGLTHHDNPITKHFRAFLQLHDLYLPSTFDDIHRGEVHTWRVASDKPGSRCDYVCLPIGWKNSKVTSQNLPDLDAGTATFDHTAVGAWCQLAFHRKRRARMAIDTSKIQTQLVDHGQDLLPQLQVIPWNCDVHQHASQIADVTTSWLQKHCGKTPGGPRADYITPDTWQLRELPFLWHVTSSTSMASQLDTD